MSKPLVLFVDDDINLLRSWGRTFAQEPYSILFATSGEEALRVLGGLKAAVIVSDFAMPKGDGVVLLAKVKELYPQMSRILVSGHATLQVATDAINSCEVQRLFEKPCNVIELGMAIREGIERSGVTGPDGAPSSIRTLEIQYPGITKVKRGNDGAIEL